MLVTDKNPSDIVCEKCGERMVILPDTEWQLWEIHTVNAICPNCLHVTEIKTIVAERARREER